MSKTLNLGTLEKRDKGSGKKAGNPCTTSQIGKDYRIPIGKAP
jgi:hypothetical protein